MKIIGGSGKEKTIQNKVVWKLEELYNAFRFYLPNIPDKELLIEHDELTAAGPAYSEEEPLNFLDVIKRLEEMTPKFYGIQASDQALLIRKRLALSQGLEMKNGSKQLFMKDATLKTVNFLDFYHHYISENATTSGDKDEITL